MWRICQEAIKEKFSDFSFHYFFSKIFLFLDEILKDDKGPDKTSPHAEKSILPLYYQDA